MVSSFTCKPRTCAHCDPPADPGADTVKVDQAAVAALLGKENADPAADGGRLSRERSRRRSRRGSRSLLRSPEEQQRKQWTTLEEQQLQSDLQLLAWRQGVEAQRQREEEDARRRAALEAQRRAEEAEAEARAAAEAREREERIQQFHRQKEEARRRREAEEEEKEEEARRAQEAQRRVEEERQREAELERQKEREEEDARQKQARVQAFLKRNGFADVNASRRRLMKTYYPLHVAVAARDAEMVELLLAAGANPLQPNSSGLTPSQLARKNSSRGSHAAVFSALGPYAV